MRIRRFHLSAASILLLPLALTAITGLAYRVGRNWFGMSDETGKFIRGLHDAAILGEAVSPVYVLFTGLGLLAMIATGLLLLRSDPVMPGAPGRSRRLHRWVAAIWALPLAVSAVTGITFRLTQSWLGWSKPQAKFLLDIHQGTYLGPTWRAYYIIVIGAGLLLLLITGCQLMSRPRKPTNP